MCSTPTVPSKIYDSNAGKPKTSFLSLCVDIVLFIYTVGFIFFRVAELVPLLSTYPLSCMNTFGALIFFVFFGLSLGFGFQERGIIKLRHIIVVATLASLVYAMDYYLPVAPPVVNSSNVKTVVITGANSGIGYETARSLVEKGVTVIMGCRSMERCQNASDQINDAISSSEGGGKAIPLVLDLSDFKSVSSFASNVKSLRVAKIDVLFNNAGYVPVAHEPINKLGLDPSFTSMHLSHHLLAELLIKQNPKLRVVATSSGTHHLCAIPFTYLPPFLLDIMSPAITQNAGCVDEQFLSKDIRSPTKNSAYIESKIANVMHVSELPRRHPTVTAVVIDLGWVGTKIQPFMKGTITPSSLKLMRSANVGIGPVLNAILRPVEYLEQQQQSGGQQQRDWSKKGGVVMNVYGAVEEPFSYPWWKNGWSGKDLSKERMEELSRKLWDETTSILRKA